MVSIPRVRSDLGLVEMQQDALARNGRWSLRSSGLIWFTLSIGSWLALAEGLRALVG